MYNNVYTQYDKINQNKISPLLHGLHSVFWIHYILAQYLFHFKLLFFKNENFTKIGFVFFLIFPPNLFNRKYFSVCLSLGFSFILSLNTKKWKHFGYPVFQNSIFSWTILMFPFQHFSSSACYSKMSVIYDCWENELIVDFNKSFWGKKECFMAPTKDVLNFKYVL